MIAITNKYNCCGCSACVQVCPKQCISFDEDEKGFRYPLVDSNKCIDCGLCTKVCPIINANDPIEPISAYAGINLDETVRSKSSSGGIFSLIAEEVINNGGIVFGARFDSNWEVKHSYAESIDSYKAFRGSKYVQSFMGESFKEVQKFLKLGKKVLFTGTPCQIAGLRNFLRKDYPNLITVDLICHGVPSPLVWREYLKSLFAKQECSKLSFSKELNKTSQITDISFRDKKNGWQRYGFSIFGNLASDTGKCLNHQQDTGQCILWESRKKNVFMELFLKDICLRPSCYKCGFKEGRSHSDISLADYWGVGAYLPHMDDKKGTSLLLVQTQKGMDLIEQLDFKKVAVNYKGAVKSNAAYYKSPLEKKEVSEFWSIFKNQDFSKIEVFLKRLQPSFTEKLVKTFKQFIYFITPIHILNSYRKKRVSKNYE